MDCQCLVQNLGTSGEIDAALPPPGFTTPTKAKCNDGAGHADPDDERMETESEVNVEKQFGESTGKKRCYVGPFTYRIIMPGWKLK